LAQTIFTSSDTTSTCQRRIQTCVSAVMSHEQQMQAPGEHDQRQLQEQGVGRKAFSSLAGWLARGACRRSQTPAAVQGLLVPEGPKPLPFVGNFRECEGSFHGEAFLKVAAEMGGIFSLRPPASAVSSGAGALGNGQPMVFLTDPMLIEEMFNRHEDFQKRTFKHSPEIRAIAGDALFTADDDEPIHDQAARILLPAFSMSGMKEYFGMVTACTEQLCERFSQHASSGELLELHPLLSQYTLEVIGQVAFGVEFNAMASENEFLRLLEERNAISIRLQKSSRFATVQGVKGYLSGDLAAMESNRAAMGRFVWEVLRKKQDALKSASEAAAEDAPKCPIMGKVGRCPVKDMAERMLTQPDPKSGELLPDANIEGQVVTFLIAGHDSTSTSITCLIYHLALNPQVEEKVYREVMEVVGPAEPITWEHLGKLPYCLQVVKENLRLVAPASMFTKTSPPDHATTLGPYHILPGTDISVPTWALHRNKKLWANPDKFDPDRFSEEQSAGRSPYAWLPFSYGKRGCIGQQLSLIEQRVALVELVRKFHVRVDPSTNITWEEPLFLDPQGIFITVAPRQHGTPATVTGSAPSVSAVSVPAPSGLGSFEQLRSKRTVVLYGSNMGTCDELADQLVSHDAGLGMNCEKSALNDVVSGSVVLPRDLEEGLVVIVASSYNGSPPDNASDIEAWLETPAGAAACRGVPFAVFGCGNKQWAATYMAFPRRLQAKLESLGAVPLLPLGEGDMNGGEVEAAFAGWNMKRTIAWLQLNQVPIPDCIRDSLHPKLPIYEAMLVLGKTAADISEHEYQPVLDESLERAQNLFLKHNKAFVADFLCNRELIAVSERSTRHIEMQLEPGVTYKAGDHLGVWGANPDEVVADYLRYLNLEKDAVVVLDLPEDPRQALIPLRRRLDLWSVLAYFVELQQPASRAQLRALSKLATDESERADLELLSEWEGGRSGEADPYVERVLSKRLTLLEVLRKYSSVTVPLGMLVGMLPSMKPRYYSISSSPEASPDRVSITVSVVTGAAPSGRSHFGVCSNHLKDTPRRWPANENDLKPIPTVVFVKNTGSAFRLPADPEIPVIMVGPGTGLAPMRGFLQERAARQAGENVLFFGCRDEDDFLYREELEAHEAAGRLQLFVAFSRKRGVPKTYVQQLIAEQSALLAELLLRGAHVYVCGDASKMAPDVRAAFAKILGGPECVEAMVARSQYCEDVWAAQSV